MPPSHASNNGISGVRENRQKEKLTFILIFSRKYGGGRAWLMATLLRRGQWRWQRGVMRRRALGRMRAPRFCAQPEKALWHSISSSNGGMYGRGGISIWLGISGVRGVGGHLAWRVATATAATPKYQRR